MKGDSAEIPFGVVGMEPEPEPSGRTGRSLVGREKEAERDEEVEEGRRALVAVFRASEGEGRLLWYSKKVASNQRAPTPTFTSLDRLESE